MKTKIHLRVAKDSNATSAKRIAKIDAKSKPDYRPLEARNEALPTVMFALELDIPDSAFRQASEVLAEIQVDPKTIEIAADVSYPDAE